MPKQRLIRALPYACGAPVLAAGLEAVWHIVSTSHFTWQTEIVAIMLLASIVFLWTFGFISRKEGQADTFPKNIIDNLPEIACVIGAGGRLRLWNSNLEAALGYTAEETAKLTAFETIAEDQRESVQQIIAKTLVEGMAKVESVLVSKDGTRIPSLLTGVRIVLSDGPCVLGIAVDLRKIRQTEESLLKLALIVECSNDAIVGKTVEGVITSWNRAAEKMYGYTVEEAVGRDMSFLFPSDKRAEMRNILKEIQGGISIDCLETQRLTKEGSIVEVSLSVSPVKDATGRVTGASTIARDITLRKRTEERLKVQSAALEAAADALLFKTALLEAQAETTIDGILAVDQCNRIILTNKQFGLHFGISDELLGTGDDKILLEHVMAKIEDPDAFLERVKYLYSHPNENSRDEIRLKNGKVFDRYSAPLVDSTSQYRGRIWYFRDITDQKLADERIQFLAYYDALTELPNRTLLRDRLAKALAGAHRQKQKVALLFLDLDRFKDVNDLLGHTVGDLLLREVAKRLNKWGREQDTIARLGGDEFLIMLTEIKEASDAAIAAKRLMDAMTAEFVIQGHSLNIGCSVGISVFPEHGVDGETLIKNADAAMYSAKDSGRNNFRFFTEDMNAQVVERLSLTNSLRSALQKAELFLVYQPQMDIETGRITGFEALLRWQHPELGVVPPDKFIKIAENSGLIVPIGEWVLRTACAQAKQWHDEDLPAVTIAVNVSAVQFRQSGFCELVRTVLRDTNFDPQFLELELTESLLLADADLTFSVLRELRAMGLTLAIDDFGTGYCSFGYLRQFGISKLKIDRSFIRDVTVQPDDAAITTAIISMAKSLNLKVIAEGVETKEQLSFLQTYRCDQIQGYYFSKPLPPAEAADKLRRSQVNALSVSNGASSGGIGLRGLRSDLQAMLEGPQGI